MKRTFECIGFMLVGAMLVCISYSVGKSDLQADSHVVTFENVIIKGKLFVDDSILVGRNSDNLKSSILIESNGHDPAIQIIKELNIRTNTPASAIMISTFEDDNGNADAEIILMDNRNNMAIGSPHLGWYTEK